MKGDVFSDTAHLIWEDVKVGLFIQELILLLVNTIYSCQLLSWFDFLDTMLLQAEHCMYRVVHNKCEHSRQFIYFCIVFSLKGVKQINSTITLKT